MESETIAMRIIASAGDSKAVAFDALEAAKNNDFDKAAELLKESDKVGIDAHQAQTDLLVSEANGEKTDINVLLIHSQDHLMTGMLAGELIAEFIELYKKCAELENEIKALKEGK